MLLLGLFYAILIPTLVGYCTLTIVNRKEVNMPFYEQISLSWGIGIGLLGLGMYTLSEFGFRLNLISSSVPALVYIFVLLPIIFRYKLIPPINFPIKQHLEIFRIDQQAFWRSIAEKLLVLLITLTIIYVFFDAMVKPIVNFDDLWRQGCIAKIIYVTGNIFTPQVFNLAGPHPFLNPLSQAWVYMGIGVWNDALGKIAFALCFTSFLMIFYRALRINMPRFYALLFTYLLTSFPLIIYHSGTAYSDFMQTYYYSTGIIYIFRWLNEDKPQLLWLSAVILGISNFIKQGGIPLGVIACTVVIFISYFENKKDNRLWIGFVLISFFVSSPWLFYKNSFLISRISQIAHKFNLFHGGSQIISGEAANAQAVVSVNPTFNDIFYHLGRRMFTYADWQILWFVFVLVIAILGVKIYKSHLKYLLIIILLDLAAVAYIFIDPSVYKYLIDGTLVQRTLMYQIPIVLLFCSYCIVEILKPADK